MTVLGIIAAVIGVGLFALLFVVIGAVLAMAGVARQENDPDALLGLALAAARKLPRSRWIAFTQRLLEQWGLDDEPVRRSVVVANLRTGRYLGDKGAWRN